MTLPGILIDWRVDVGARYDHLRRPTPVRYGDHAVTAGDLRAAAAELDIPHPKPYNCPHPLFTSFLS